MTPVKVAPASIPTLPNPQQINSIEKKKKIVVSLPTSKSIKKLRISRVNAKKLLLFRGCGFQLQNLLGLMSQRPLARA